MLTQRAVRPGLATGLFYLFDDAHSSGQGVVANNSTVTLPRSQLELSSFHLLSNLRPSTTKINIGIMLCCLISSNSDTIDMFD